MIVQAVPEHGVHFVISMAENKAETKDDVHWCTRIRGSFINKVTRDKGGA